MHNRNYTRSCVRGAGQPAGPALGHDQHAVAKRTTACETRLRHNRPRVANRHDQSTPPAAGPANRRRGSGCRWGTWGPEADQVRDQAVRSGAPLASYFCSQHKQLLRDGELAGIRYLLSMTSTDGSRLYLPTRVLASIFGAPQRFRSEARMLRSCGEARTGSGTRCPDAPGKANRSEGSGMKFWIFENVLGRGFGERLRSEGLESLERGFWVGCRNEIADGKI